MKQTLRIGSRALISVCIGLGLYPGAFAQDDVVHYVRYEHQGTTSYGILEGDTVRELDGDLFSGSGPTGDTVPLESVRLLAPCEPGKVIAVGLNYKSHLGGQEPSAEPGLFAKMPTCIVGPGAAIVLPEDARAVHYEAELVLVIGKKAKNVSVADAKDYIFGVTCGNDVSGRAWQGSDLQWFRAKASDTFGPIGPAIVTGLNYDDLMLRGRLNGETKQEQRTSDLLHDASAIVSFASRYVTLMPGDVIFTGTPGSTSSIKSGDVVEIELEGVGTLSNPVITQAEWDAREAASERGRKNIAAIMQLMDGNGDGFITEDEAPGILKKNFNIADQNQDGKVDTDEALVVMGVIQDMKIDGNLVMLLLDSDGDGKITREEAPRQLREGFEIIDQNKDGILDRAEAEMIAIFLSNLIE